MSIESKKQPGRIWLTVALICFFNPCIGIMDVLPDFIGAFILARILKDAADLSPYFSESRTAFLKLGLCGLAKFICQFTVFNRNNVTVQGDMSAMFSITFLVLDTIFAITAVRYLFEGVFYLGERSDAQALYKPFPLFGAKGPMCDPERLKSVTFFFIVLKHTLCTLPEFLRLSRDPADTSDDPARFYGKALLACVIVVAVVGIAWLFTALRYKRAIYKEGRAFDALRDRLLPEELARYTDRVRRHTFRSAGYLFTLAAALMLPLRLDSYGGLNIMPYFLFPFLVFLSMRMLAPYLPQAKRCQWAALPVILTSLASYITQAIFFETYTYIDLLNSNKAAILYGVHTVVNAIDTAAVIALLLLCLRVVFTFIQAYTVCDEQSSSFTSVDSDYQASTRRYTTVCFVVFIISAIARLGDVLQRGRVDVVFGNPDFGFSYTTVTGMLPWFSTLTALLTGFAVLTAGFLFLRLRDAFRLRYPDKD